MALPLPTTTWADRSLISPDTMRQLIRHLAAVDVDLAAGDVNLETQADADGNAGGNAYYGTLRLVGVLPANRTVTLPAEDGRRWLVHNGTTGAFTVTLETAAGAGVVVAQGKSAFLQADGVDIIRASPDTDPTP
jgi:hypothetical protein